MIYKRNNMPDMDSYSETGEAAKAQEVPGQTLRRREARGKIQTGRAV
jgi:hypothetical protein